MASTEEPSGTVLHRLIQEQLRYGNPTDARTLLAIQQQALRGGSGGFPGGGPGSGAEEGPGRSPRSSLESLTQEDSSFLQLSARQEPQGQEHHGDYQHSESSYQLYQLHGEELPTYEQAKAHSQYLAQHWSTTTGPHKQLREGTLLRDGDYRAAEEELIELKRGHVRSLSERLLQLSLERNCAMAKSEAVKSSSHSYPELGYYAPPQGLQDKRSPHPEYSSVTIMTQGYMPIHAQEPQCVYRDMPQPLQIHQHRYAAPAQQQAEACYGVFTSLPPGGVEEPRQTELLMLDNERLRQELEGHREKACRIHKLEQEVQRVSEAYETLLQGSCKRESLEQTLRSRLVDKISRLQDFNRDLQESLANARTHAAKDVEAAEHNQHIMTKLLEQNEEQQFERERAERELQRLRNSAEEQGLRVEQLEEALEAKRCKGRQLEEELRRKRAYVEKVERLQSALAQLQTTCEKREGLEMRLRTRLEQELKSLRAQQRQSHPPGVTVGSLHERLREREERILALEADMVRWEQKYLEESTMRQFAMDVAATAAQRDTTIINHSPCHSSNNSFNEDLPVADYRNQEMENRIRALYTQILAKDAVINILHQHLHQEQIKKDGSCLPTATYTPVSTASYTSIGKGKSLSDDQTALSPLLCSSAAHPSQSCGSEDGAKVKEPATGCKLSIDDAAAQHHNASLNPLRGPDDLEAEAVEIFI
ncbi:angiomotin-like 2a isoform X1 [Coregonus clupeaformis]|uniref:angiomotin-like 2a isoform X1 n=1 Tax=Coregonus clupeaformis TaxID=59861 RepID=UPI001BE06A17|nr:angiomotin-like 2a isoform X1 [Coregonus clupeaformis]